MYHVGGQYIPEESDSWDYSKSGEMTIVTNAFRDARHLALGRLRKEAALLNASGVAGVRVEGKKYEWGATIMEFSAFGTAIRETGVPCPPGEEPFLSDLSGEEVSASAAERISTRRYCDRQLHLLLRAEPVDAKRRIRRPFGRRLGQQGSRGIHKVGL